MSPDATPDAVPACQPIPVVSDVVGCSGIGFGLPSVGIGVAHVLSRLADVNADGKLDLLAPELPGGIAVAFGRGDGTFADIVRYTAGSEPVGLAVGDLDGDGAPDLAAVSQESGEDVVYLLMNQGDGTFTAATTISVVAAPRAVAIGDLDADGINDLVVASYATEGLTVLRGTGGGNFAAGTIYPVFRPYRVAIGKLDTDAYPDVVAVGFSNTMSVMKNLGDGTFGPALGVAIDSQGNDVAIADFNSDGEGDVAVAAGSVMVFPGKGNAGLDVPTTFPFLASGLAVGDLDQDANPDLAIAGWDGLGIWLSGSTSVTTYPFLAPAQGPDAVSAGDLDGDGDPDLALASVNNRGNGIALLRNPGGGVFPQPKVVESASLDVAEARDLNGDGRADVVVADRELRVYVDGALVVSYALESFAFAASFGDVDGDAHVDVVVATEVDIQVFRGNGTGSLAKAGKYPIGSVAFSVDIVDLNGDARPDLVVTHPAPVIGSSSTEKTVGVLLNNGDGSFAPQVTYPVGEVSSAAIADFDGDRIPDIAAASYVPPEIVILHGVGDGTFTRLHAIPAEHPSAIATVDVDGDCIGELFVVTGAPEIMVLRGLGDGTFETRAVVPTLAAPGKTPLRIVEFDGDKIYDVVTSNYLGIAVHFGRADGTYSAPFVYNMPGMPRLAGDLDDDGRLDLLVVRQSAGSDAPYVYEVFGSCGQ